MIRKILGPFVNTLIADENYSALNRDHFYQDLQMRLSQKEKNFSAFLFAFSKFRFNFEHFQKKDDPIGGIFLNLGTPEKVVK